MAHATAGEGRGGSRAEGAAQRGGWRGRCGGPDSDGGRDASDSESDGGGPGDVDGRLWGWAGGRCRVVWADSQAGWGERERRWGSGPDADADGGPAPWLEGLAGKRSAVMAALAAAAALLV